MTKKTKHIKQFNLLDILLPYQKKFFLNKKKRKIWISSRQVGKSFSIAFLLVYKALVKKNGLSLCISVNQNSAAEIIRKVEQVAEAVKNLSKGKIKYEKSFDKVVFSNGSRVLSLSSNPAGARGYTAQMVAIDESAFVEHLDQVLAAIGPTLSRDKNAELVLCTTPAGKNGHFYQLFENAQKNPDEWYIQKTSIFDAINNGLKGINVEQLRSLCPDDNIFRQEYLCEFSNSVNALIDTNLLEVWVNPPDFSNVEYFIGIDIGRTTDKTAISVIARDKNTNIKYLVDVKTLEKMEFAKQIIQFKNIFNKYQPKLLYGDSGGIGKPVMEELNTQFNTRCKGFTFSNTTKNNSYEYFRKNIFNRQLFFSPQYIKDIESDISQIKQTITDSGNVIYSATRYNGRHSDIFSSLVLALQAEHDTVINTMTPISFRKTSRF